MPLSHDSATSGAVLRRRAATAAHSNGTFRFPLSEFMGLVQYRNVFSQVCPVPRAFGLPVVRIQSCLAVREHMFHHRIM